MNRTARFDFDPMARPAPITCCSVARHHYPTPDERTESATAAKRGRGRPRTVALPKTAGNPHFGNCMRSEIETDWVSLIGALVAASSKRAVMDETGASKFAINCWLRGAHVPSPPMGQKLAAMYRKLVGPQLPQAKE